MFRFVLVMVLGIITLVATPLDAQIFRRFARQRARQVQPRRQVQPKPARPKTASQQSQQQRQPNLQQQNQANRAGSKQTTATKPVTGRKDVAAKGTSAASRKTPQRYGLFYNRQTGQTFRRPIQPAAPNTSSAARLNSNAARSTARTRQPVAAVDKKAAQYDIARQSPTESPRPASSLTLNAPQSVGASQALPVQPRTAVANTAIPPKPSAGSSVKQPAGVPAKQTPAEPSTKTFSVLEIDK